MTYPSGKTVGYHWSPFGPVSGWTWSNGATYQRNDQIGKGIAKQLAEKAFESVELFQKIIEKIDTEPVGPYSPTEDKLQCGLLDRNLQKDYIKMFGDKKRLTPEEAAKYLNEMWNKYPQMKDLYPAPEEMLKEAEDNSKNNWFYKLRPYN